MTFIDDYLAAWNNWNYKQCCELKKLRHFALVLGETVSGGNFTASGGFRSD